MASPTLFSKLGQELRLVVLEIWGRNYEHGTVRIKSQRRSRDVRTTGQNFWGGTKNKSRYIRDEGQSLRRATRSAEEVEGDGAFKRRGEGKTFMTLRKRKRRKESVLHFARELGQRY